MEELSIVGRRVALLLLLHQTSIRYFVLLLMEAPIITTGSLIHGMMKILMAQ